MNKSPKRAVWINAAFFLLQLICLTGGLWNPKLGHSKPLASFSGLHSLYVHPIGSIKGVVKDAENGKPVDYARIVVLDLNRITYTNDLGEFELEQLPEGSIILAVFRIGYESKDIQIELRANETKTITIELSPQPITSKTVVVQAKRDDNSGIVGEAVYQISGEKLRNSLGITVAKTVDGEPGMSMRSMGPAPARPVLRGLGGDRLLILEDGQRTGDLSATSNDHAVAIDPLNADQIEVYRGPEALQFGSNTLAGVINVWNRSISTQIPPKYQLTSSLQTETVNQARALGLLYQQPISNWVVTTNLSLRGADDIATPVSTLKNSGIETYRGSLGVSYIKDWGYLGISVSRLDSKYGLPGGFIGAHPNGVDIEMQRNQMELKSSVVLGGTYWHHIDASFNLTEYYHQEYEGRGFLGVEFGVLTYTSNITLHTYETLFGRSNLGLWGSWRDYANGGFSFTPNAIERELAGFFYHEKVFTKSVLEFSLRYDYKQVDPFEERQSRAVGLIRDRIFHSWSGALEYSHHLSTFLDVGARIMRTFRAPGLEELFSEGPHLAAYSYEVGFANNGIESAVGTEIFLKWHSGSSRAQVNVYRNQFSDYLFPRDIDSLNIAQLLPIYRFTGQDALFYGFEGVFNQEFGSNWSWENILSYTWAELLDDRMPVPFIPPLTIKSEINYRRNQFDCRLFSRIALNQNRLGEFEEPTDGFVIFGAGLTYSKQLWGGLHLFSLQCENIFDSTYRNHLSRVKSVMPEPGRNISLLYRAYF